MTVSVTAIKQDDEVGPLLLKGLKQIVALGVQLCGGLTRTHGEAGLDRSVG